MAQFRPIIYDYIGGGRPSLEDRARAVLRENKRPVPQYGVRTVPGASDPALAGTKVRSGLGGGVFNPRATSGML